ncbi:MAG: type I glyceraldehyde-3-phosphate dehydrogenase [Crocinitomicaceae bacterium]|nr:type I glyceraldehyde-3-phosphate dehydrogenase [Crocinitomicaceae bacterium]
MEKKKIAINGFGRIGRRLLRILIERENVEVVAINDLYDSHTMAHLFKYDSVHGKFSGIVTAEKDYLLINGSKIKYSSEKLPANLPWKEAGVDIAVECTGQLKQMSALKKHLEAGARRVLLSAPADDDGIKTVVPGVNDDIYSQEDRILSCASCTTNNAAPMIKLVDELCGIDTCYITTIHSYTGDQRLHDAPHKDLRRARAATQSIVPTTTGAAKALTRIFPSLNGRMGGCGIRVPVPDGSLTDITCTVKAPLNINFINGAFRKAAEERWKGILEYSEDPVVSADIIGNPHSCLFDAQLTSVIGNMVKVVGWYDNETGYSNRLADMIFKW